MRPLGIGVCSWSIDRTKPVESIRAAAISAPRLDQQALLRGPAPH